MTEGVTEQRIIALAAGGTGGHMFPAEALAQEMKRRGWGVVLFTDSRGMRYAENFPADEIIELKAANPNAHGLGAKVSAGFAMLRGLGTALKVIKARKPDFVIGFGGYPSASGIIAAQQTKTLYGVHEQNAVLGRVNRFVAPKAQFIAHGFPALSRLPETQAKIIPLGNPVRDNIKSKSRAAFVPPAGFSAVTLFVFGGSQGASLFSKVVPPAVLALPEELRKRLRVVQQVREADIDETRELYQQVGIHVELAPFFNNIEDKLAEAHLVIARAGASSVTELAVMGRPSILIPLGIAMDDHQTGNAKVLVDAGAAELIAEEGFAPETLMPVLENLLTNPIKLSQMAEAAKTAAPEKAVGKLADVIEEHCNLTS